MTNQATGIARGKGYISIPYRAIWIESLEKSVVGSELWLVRDDGEEIRKMGTRVWMNFTRVIAV